MLSFSLSLCMESFDVCQMMKCIDLQIYHSNGTSYFLGVHSLFNKCIMLGLTNLDRKIFQLTAVETENFQFIQKFDKFSICLILVAAVTVAMGVVTRTAVAPHAVSHELTLNICLNHFSVAFSFSSKSVPFVVLFPFRLDERKRANATNFHRFQTYLRIKFSTIHSSVYIHCKKFH